VVDTLGLFLLVGLLQVVAGLAGLAGGAFALSAPLSSRPWTLVTSVYAHAGPGHLLANAVALAGGGGAVVGASGAVFALLGYLLAGNVVTARLLDRIELPPRAQVGLFVAVAAAVTVATAGPGVR